MLKNQNSGNCTLLGQKKFTKKGQVSPTLVTAV